MGLGNAPVTGKVTFRGSGGRLHLALPATFAGTVAGFATPDGLDLPSIGFGTTTTLAFCENNGWTCGTLTVTDGTHTAADGHHGDTLITEGPQTANQQPLLTQPHAI